MSYLGGAGHHRRAERYPVVKRCGPTAILASA